MRKGKAGKDPLNIILIFVSFNPCNTLLATQGPFVRFRALSPPVPFPHDYWCKALVQWVKGGYGGSVLVHPYCDKNEIISKQKNLPDGQKMVEK